MNKYLLIPRNGTFSEREFITFNGKTFYIEEIKKVDGIILDEKPNFKKHKKESGVPFESCTFKNDRQERLSRQIVLDDTFSPQEKKKLSALFRKNFLFHEYEENGWNKIREQRLFFGEFDVVDVPCVELRLFTGTIQAAKHEISKETFLDYRKNGMPADVYEEMKEDTDFSDPIFSDYSTLTANDQKVRGFLGYLRKAIDSAIFNLSDIPTEASGVVSSGRDSSSGKSQKKKEKKSQPFAFAFNAWTKRAWYSLEIYEKFELSRIRTKVERHFVYPMKEPVYTYELAYEGVDGVLSKFDFYSDSGTDSDSSFLYDDKGRAFGFEVRKDHEDDYDSYEDGYDDEDEDEDEDE